MRFYFAVLFLLCLKYHSVESGSPCPSSKNMYPCSCTNFEDGLTLVVCPSIHNTSHLEEVTKSMKSMIIDRLLLLNTFMDNRNVDDFSNAVDPKTKIPLQGVFPKKWLSEVRVRDLEIQNANLNGYFIFDDTLEGQSDFLTGIVVKNSNLRGHICSSCGPASNTVAFATSELKRVPAVKEVDLSFNQLEFVDGFAFPAQLKELKKIVLSNNQITRLHDNAFSNLQHLNHLDVSRNRLKSISRKIFRNPDNSLNTIDISYNSIQFLPEDMFQALNGLKEIKLSHNLLETLPATTWSRIPALLEKVDLRGNFLVCNCTMNWIARRLSKSTKLVAHCVAPKQAEFQELKPNLASISTACS
ncbi:hypothetical protein AVEN_251855-1 [Araneus ventricosus]|uniref:Uncharacterized protein n=1 Tax=Araneus ventricosus TaxID=182803 RepID=A0A4Y2FV22_ARAVE|nr:hypothetical protein AVEN_251855-1 [Araneus ventricosus]